MKTQVALVVLLLAVVALVPTHGVRRRAAVANPYKGVQRNIKHNYGSAAAYFALLDQYRPGKVDRIIKKNFPAGRKQLEKEVDQDADMALDLDNEAVLFVCTGLAVNVAPPTIPGVEAGAGTSDTGLAAAGSDPSYTQAFSLSSRPSAVKKMYLDFTGYTLTGTAWNSGRADPIILPSYDTDGNPAAFSDAEMSNIVQIWRYVAEDYAAWDLDITTIEPVPYDASKHLRVVIGGDNAWYTSTPYGGVAYVDIAFKPEYLNLQPALVFPANLGNGYPKYVSEAISHEAGHNIGLSHDGQILPDGTTNAYYQGDTSGVWAPIMGVGYYSQVTQWSKGEYQYANQLQDDTDIISQHVAWLTSSNSNSIGTATPLDVTVSGTTATGTGNGVIAQQDVPYMFSFNTAAGAASFAVYVTPPDASGRTRADLDVQLVVQSATGTLATVNPSGVATSNGLGIATVGVNLPSSGIYYVNVSGVGYKDALTTYYTSYSSKGYFSLTATFQAPGTAVSPSPSPSLSLSPSPSPSPSPNPQPGLYMTLGSISYPGTPGSCSVTVTIKDSAGTAQQGASVTGTWTSNQGSLGSSTSNTDSTGTASFTSARITNRKSAKWCMFTVNSVTKSGFSGAANLPQSTPRFMLVN